MRKFLAIWIAKLALILGKLFGKKGSSTPGKLALKIYPNILYDLANQLPKSNIIAVCGTNGKTTTNNLLYSMLKADGKEVVCNNIGANMLEGVTTAIVQSSNLFGRIKAEYATIEIDEISAIRVFDFLKPKYMIITNFFRDQLDRYGEIDIIINKLKKAIDKVSDMELIINCDDPITYWFGKGRICHYYGVSEKVLPFDSIEAKEGRFCRECGAELEYKYYHYSQLGDYQCPKCGFERPYPKYSATNVSLYNGISFYVEENKLSMKYKGFYNIYNVLGAYVVARLLGVDISTIKQVLKNYKTQIGRMEQFMIGKQVVFNLSKNPAGFNQALSTMLEDKASKDVLFIINDNAQDGKDISWIWDVDFERAGKGIKNYGVAGLRRHDIMVRLKYAGFDLNSVHKFNQVEQAINSLLQTDSEVLYIFVNYTALFSTHNILKRLEAKG